MYTGCVHRVQLPKHQKSKYQAYQTYYQNKIERKHSSTEIKIWEEEA